jgi:hypothetical protein
MTNKNQESKELLKSMSELRILKKDIEQNVDLIMKTIDNNQSQQLNKKFDDFEDKLKKIEEKLSSNLVSFRQQKINSNTDWFECAFGFHEQDYENAKTNFEKMYSQSKNMHLNGMPIGNFQIANNNQFANLRFALSGKITIENIVADIRQIHADKNLSANATIQVASQFNCLEMGNPNLSPENGITIYQYDKTQGSICAMTTPAGLAYRNYLYNGGQSKKNQIDTTSALLTYLRKMNLSIKWKMQNGYMMFNNDEELKKINRVLLRDPIIRRLARNLIQVGLHTDQGVCIDGKKFDHVVNHVYCSGLPINYNYYVNKNLWDGLAELFLEAMYENTLLAACENNMRNGQNNPCYLTKVGGGVFGMKYEQITRAINRACQVVALRGLSLTVKIVHYGQVENGYEDLHGIEYPLKNVDMNSVWDDPKWQQLSQ